VEWRYRLSAFKHGVVEDSIRHAVAQALFVDEDFQTTEPPKVLIVGPDHAGNLLEIVGKFDADDVLLVFHAMAIRPSILGLIGPLDE
jgi:hypothetical protein